MLCRNHARCAGICTRWQDALAALGHSVSRHTPVDRHYAPDAEAFLGASLRQGGVVWSLVAVVGIALAQGCFRQRAWGPRYDAEHLSAVYLSAACALYGYGRHQVSWHVLGFSCGQCLHHADRAALSNIIGTTGAAVLLIRPLLQANAWRMKKVHTILFFIFIVGNIGGSLNPVGNPPLLMGFIKKVDFFWPPSSF